MNILGTKVDGYCVALVLIILFFIYVDNDNVENYGNFAPIDNSEYTDEGDHEGDNEDHEGDKVDHEVAHSEHADSDETIGEVPKSIDMMPPLSMEKEMGLLQGASVGDAEDFMLLEQAFKPGLSVTDADLDTGFPRVGGPGNLGQDFSGDMGSDSLSGLDSIGQGLGQDVGPGLGKDTGSGGDLKVILVYAPWCGWSKKALPDYDKLTNEYNGKNIGGWNVSVIRYNSDEREDMVKEYDVEGFPSFYVEINGERQEAPREYNEQVSMIKEITSSA